ncbi:MAG: hypothetical protein ACRD0P_10845 [Stackebrandtia sp.]
MSAPKETEAADESMERRFRRLLRAYPGWYRKTRGEEMLTTLMDAAEGRNRPTVGQRFDVIFGGLRKHLSVGSLPAAVLGVLAAVFVATLGAIAGSVAGWNTAADLPDGAAADRMARQAVPDVGEEVFDYEFRSLFAWQDMQGEPHDRLLMIGQGDNYSAGHLAYVLDHKPDDFDRLATARERLEWAGWNVGPTTRTDSDSREFSATRDGLTMIVEGSKNTGWSETKSSMTSVTVYRSPPTSLPALTIAGLIVGAVAGWLLTGRLRQRVAGWPAPRRTAAAVALGIGGFILFFPTVICLSLVVIALNNPDERIAVWQGYTWGPMAIVTMLGLAALVASALCRYLPFVPRREGWYQPVRDR